jgi:hypothetical protein
MVDGNISRSLVEILHGIPALSHHIPYQPIGFPDSLDRVIDELCLDPAPLL